MRIARLDGIRALAVCMVLLLHHQLFPFGMLGVDLFFVLSGFLITGILRKSRHHHGYWSAFYTKRATRIVPPLLLLIPVAYVITKHAKVLSLLEYLFFLGGLDVVRSNSIPTLDNLWSLAVEEHFYLLWPFAVRFLRRSSLLFVLLAVLIGEPMLRLLMTPLFAHSEAIYFLTPFRLDGLAAGSMLALAIESEAAKSVLARFSGLVGCGAVALFAGLCWFCAPSFHPYANTPLYNAASYSLAALMMTAFIAYVLLNAESFVSRVLSYTPLVWIGTISYGVYLYGDIVQAAVLKLAHCPFYPAPASLEHRVFPVDAIAIVLLAWLSFRFYEHPIVLWGKRKADHQVLSEIPAYETEISPA